jgi:hypothetical protein
VDWGITYQSTQLTIKKDLMLDIVGPHSMSILTSCLGDSHCNCFRCARCRYCLWRTRLRERNRRGNARSSGNGDCGAGDGDCSTGNGNSFSRNTVARQSDSCGDGDCSTGDGNSLSRNAVARLSDSDCSTGDGNSSSRNAVARQSDRCGDGNSCSRDTVARQSDGSGNCDRSSWDSIARERNSITRKSDSDRDSLWRGCYCRDASRQSDSRPRQSYGSRGCSLSDSHSGNWLGRGGVACLSCEYRGGSWRCSVVCLRCKYCRGSGWHARVNSDDGRDGVMREVRQHGAQSSSEWVDILTVCTHWGGNSPCSNLRLVKQTLELVIERLSDFGTASCTLATTTATPTGPKPNTGVGALGQRQNAEKKNEIHLGK